MEGCRIPDAAGIFFSAGLSWGWAIPAASASAKIEKPVFLIIKVL
jgi:hypothetical protein